MIERTLLDLLSDAKERMGGGGGGGSGCRDHWHQNDPVSPLYQARLRDDIKNVRTISATEFTSSIILVREWLILAPTTRSWHR